MRSIWKIVFFIASHEFGICESQEKPYYTIPKFSNEPVRQNFCDVHRKVQSGEIKRRDALRDMDLRPVLFPDQLNEEGAIDEANPDIAVDFLDELARRAGFRWRDSYGVAKNAENETWTELLLWTSNTYDFVGNWFLKTGERAALGVLQNDGWYDSSLIMVKKEDEEGRNFFNFLRPFTNGLWILIGITVLVTGVIYYLLDYFDAQRHSKEMDLGLINSMFNAAWIFTGHTLHNPKSTATRFLIFSLSFLCLLIVAAYTANLASFLITRGTNEMKINDIHDVVKYDLSCCVDEDTSNQQLMEEHYPSVKLVPVPDPLWGREIYHAYGRSECDVILTDLDSFEKLKKEEEFNPHCNLEWIGRKVNENRGDFCVMDSVNFCSSLLSDVLGIHMLEMKTDRTFQSIWDRYRLRSDTGFCTSAKKENKDADSLGVDNMFGIFSLYYGVILISIMWSFYQWYRAEKKHKLSSLQDSSVSNAASVQEVTSSSMVPSGMGANIEKEKLPADWRRIEVEDTNLFPSPSEECKENTSWQHQIWDKLLRIEKDRDDLRELLENDRKGRDDLRELFESDRKGRDDLRELFESDRKGRDDLRELYESDRKGRDDLRELYENDRKDREDLRKLLINKTDYLSELFRDTSLRNSLNKKKD